MDVEILRQHFERGAQQAVHGAGRQTTLPILAHILIETEKGHLKFSSTDLEMGIQIWVPCKVKKEGKLTVPARILSQFSSTIIGEKVQLKSGKEALLEIKTGTTTARIKTLPPDDFPIIPIIRKETIAVLPSNLFIKGLRSVVSFTSSSEMRPELTGVFCSFLKNGAVTMVATDSFRLAEKKISKGTAEKAKEYQCIIPLKTVQEVIRIFSDSDDSETISILSEDNQLLFKGTSAHIITRLIEGNYPSYDSLIPSTTATTATVDKNAIIDGLKASGIFTGTHQDITIAFKQKANQLIITGRDIEQGESEVIIDGDVSGNDEDITFNYRYLLEGLSGIETSDVIIGINDSMKPGLLKPTRKEGFLYIIMPIKR